MKYMYLLVITLCILSCSQQNEPEIVLPSCTTTIEITQSESASQEPDTTILRTCVVTEKLYKYDEHWLKGNCINPGNVCKYYRAGQSLIMKIDETQFNTVQVGDTIYGHWDKGVL